MRKENRFLLLNLILKFIRRLFHVVISRDIPFKAYRIRIRLMTCNKTQGCRRARELPLTSFMSCGGGWCHIESVPRTETGESCSRITIGLKNEYDYGPVKRKVAIVARGVENDLSILLRICWCSFSSKPRSVTNHREMISSGVAGKRLRATKRHKPPGQTDRRTSFAIATIKEKPLWCI